MFNQVKNYLRKAFNNRRYISSTIIRTKKDNKNQISKQEQQSCRLNNKEQSYLRINSTNRLKQAKYKECKISETNKTKEIEETKSVLFLIFLCILKSC